MKILNIGKKGKESMADEELLNHYMTRRNWMKVSNVIGCKPCVIKDKNKIEFKIRAVGKTVTIYITHGQLLKVKSPVGKKRTIVNIEYYIPTHIFKNKGFAI